MFERFFYRFYKWAKDLGLDNTPEWTSIITISAIQYMNLFSIILLFSFNTHIGWLLRKDGTFTPFLIGIFILLMINYYRYAYKEKYKNIENKYKKESKEQKYKENILAWGYIILSIITLSISAFVKESMAK